LDDWWRNGIDIVGAVFTKFVEDKRKFHQNVFGYKVGKFYNIGPHVVGCAAG
jgi:hypothetical protein